MIDGHSILQKIRHYTDWSPDHEDFVAVLDMHAELWEYFKPMKPTLAMSSKKKSSMAAHMSDGCGGAFDPDADFGVDVLVTEPEQIDLASWLRSWNEIIAMARGSISYLPDWIMVLVKIMFRTLNRRGKLLSFCFLTFLSSCLAYSTF